MTIIPAFRNSSKNFKGQLLRALLRASLRLSLLCFALAFSGWFLGSFTAPVYGQQPRLRPQLERNTTPGSANYFPFADVRKVFEKWSPNQHLYVQGNLRLSQSQLMGLESWIHKNGPHWTVILMEDASLQRYTNRDGRIETGMDAVELFLGDLAEVGSFRSLVNPVTGEQDGAVFVLVLKQRNLSYRASEAQNRRGLGQNRWIGNLDRPAFRAMRGGGRVLDAVRDTITSINQPLTRAILQEQKMAQQRKQQRQREIDALLARLGDVENKLKRIETSAAAVAKENPESTADLTSPDVASIRQQMTEITKALKAKDAKIGPIKQSTSKVVTSSDDWINLYREYERFETSEKQLMQRKDQLAADAGDLKSDLNTTLANVDKMLSNARSAYEDANSEFQKHLNSATYELADASKQLLRLQKERQQQQARKSFIRRAIAAIGSVFAAMFAGLFLWLNRKRAPAKARAIEKLEQRQGEVREELHGMGDLLKRADVVIGDRKAIERKGYQGKTKDLSSKALDDIDQILVMSSSVDKVIDGAKEKIEPKSWWGKITNWWSPENFNEGFELLENKPIEFGENEGISLVKEHDAATDDDPLTEGPEKVSLSFSELFKIFRERSDSANATIGEVEAGWTQIVSTNKDLQVAIDEASGHEQSASEATEADGLLDVPQLFDELLKSAQADQDEAELIGKHDPISAIEGPATTGLRKAANADALAQQLVAVRESLVPSIRDDTTSLDQRGRAVEWVDAALDDFTDRAQALATDALGRDVSEGISDWRSSFEKFDTAVGDSVKLHDQSVNELHPEIASLRSQVNSAKDTIGKRLSLPPEQALAELDRNPLRLLQSADEHNAATLASLDRGDPQAARLSVAETQQMIDDAESARAQSLQVLDSLMPEVQTLETRFESSQSRLGETERLIGELQDSFAASSLMIDGVRWGADPSDSGEEETAGKKSTVLSEISAADLFLLATRQSQKTQNAVSTARELYKSGRLLAAEDSYQLGQHQIENSEFNQSLISNRAVELRQMVEDNAGELELLQQRFGNLDQQMQQHFVTTETQEMLRSEYRKFTDLQQAIESTTMRRDPFNEAGSIKEVNQDLEKLVQQIEYDKSLFEEAGRSVNSLIQVVSQSESPVSRSQRDQIPDSPEVRQSIESLRNANAVAAQLKKRLQQPHEDWRDIDRQADTAVGGATQALANLRTELELAQKAANEIQSTASSYQQALNWSGSYGIRANPGRARASLDQARALLGAGDYQSAMQYARQANQYVMNSIAAAETEVMRRRAAERRAAEAQRRAARRRTSSNRSILGSGSSGGWSSSSRRSSSASRSSSSSRSSGGGRGGFSRSGW